MENKILKVNSVKLDTIVIQKIIRLANDNGESMGYLLGIVKEEAAEVTNSYPILSQQDQEYQQEHDKLMMEYARRHSLDSNKVGLYLITDDQAHLERDIFESLLRVQFYVKYAFIVTYSPLLQKQGHPQPFQAFVINEKYGELFNKEEVDFEDIQSFNLKYDRVYKQIPVEVIKTPLTLQFLHQYSNQINSQYKNQEIKFTNNLQSYSKQLIEVIDQQINQSERINQDYTKTTPLPAAELTDYLFLMTKSNNLAEQIKKDSTYTIESEVTLNGLLK